MPPGPLALHAPARTLLFLLLGALPVLPEARVAIELWHRRPLCLLAAHPQRFPASKK